MSRIEEIDEQISALQEERQLLQSAQQYAPLAEALFKVYGVVERAGEWERESLKGDNRWVQPMHARYIRTAAALLIDAQAILPGLSIQDLARLVTAIAESRDKGRKPE